MTTAREQVPRFLRPALVVACALLLHGASRAANNPFGTNLYFGITMSPSSPLSAGQLDQLDQAGNNWLDLQFSWSAYEPQQGQYSASYVAQIQQSIDDALSRGWNVGLRLSWQYTPGWATQLPEARFVNQYGDLFTDTGSSGRNVVAFPFHQNLRNIIGATMTNFFAAMQSGASGDYMRKLSAIGFGGGFYGEINLPEPTFNGHSNCYWAYSNEARTMFQAYLAARYGTIAALNAAWGGSYSSFAGVSFTPGQSSLNHGAAADFLDWLCQVQQQYVLFQRNLIRGFYDGYIMPELGGWGMRTNYVSANIALDLNGSGPGADSVSKVYDFANFLRVLSDAGETKVMADCTWIDPSLSYSGWGNPCPAAWIAGLARQYNFLSCGEYTANSTALDLGAARINSCGMVLGFYVPVSRFFAGSYPTVQDWGAMIDRSQRRFDASVPYLLSYDIGSVGTIGTDTITAGVISSSGAGSGCRSGGSSDQFHYLAAILEGDGQFAIKVDSMSALPGAQTGLMIRQTLNANDLYTAVFLGDNQCTMQSRRILGAAAQTLSSRSSVAAPQWLKIQRTGNNITTWVSSDGQSWTSLGAQANTMAHACYIGIAISSGSSALNDSSLRATDAPSACIYAQDFNAPGATPATLGWNGGFAYAGADSETQAITAAGVGGSGGLVTTLHITNGANLGAFTEFWSGTLTLPAGATASNLSLRADFTGSQNAVPFSLKLNDHAGNYIVFSSTVRTAGVFQTVGGPLSTASVIDPAFNFAGTGGYSVILSFDGVGGTPWAEGTGSLTIDNVVLQSITSVNAFSVSTRIEAPAVAVLTWPSLTGHAYTVQQTGTFGSGWTDASPPIISVSNTISWTNPVEGARRFYRVRAQ